MTDKEIKEVFDFYKKAGQKSLIYESISDQLMHVDSNEFNKITILSITSPHSLPYVSLVNLSFLNLVIMI